MTQSLADTENEHKMLNFGPIYKNKQTDNHKSKT